MNLNMDSFDQLGLPSFLIDTIEKLGYKEPTEVQAKAIPKALEGSNIIGLSQTGTGKTAAFLLPIISNLSNGRSKARMPRSLVLCPTRELAAQVMENFENYSKNTRLTSALLIGGVSFKDQDKKLDRGVDIIIATPGRLLDQFERGKLMLTGVEFLAIDEADKMLDMGFIPDITRILESLPSVKQKILFSATIGKEIENLIAKFIKKAFKVEIAPSASITKNVNQVLLSIEDFEAKKENKKDFLIRFLRHEKSLVNAIIFCNRKKEVSYLSSLLRKNKLIAGEIHGDLDQKARMEMVKNFKDGHLKYLVASDVAARGLDIPNVSHVINFDVPLNPEDYVHRIGRTGRAGKKGTAITIVQEKDKVLISNIEALINEKIQPLNKGWLKSIVETSNTKEKTPAVNAQPPNRAQSQLPDFLFTKF